MKYYAPDTWQEILPGHIRLTLSRRVLIPSYTVHVFFLNAGRQGKEQLVPVLKSLVWTDQGSNLQTPVT